MVREVVGWNWPRRDAAAELKSLLFQANRFRIGEKPSDEKVVEVTKRMLEEYPKVKPIPVFTQVGGVFGLSRAAFEIFYPSVLLDVKKDASPGMPFMGLGCLDNAAVLSRYPDQLKEAVWERLEVLSFGDVERMNAVQIVQSGAADPVRIFVKNEPHPELKIQQGRMRLISSVSLIDQIVERFLLSNQNKAEIDSWGVIPSKPGMGLHDEGLQTLWEGVRTWGDTYEADISGWDFGLQSWEMLWEADVRAGLANMVGTLYHKALRARAWAEANSLFMLSNGTLIAQTIAGKRCSGSYNTSAGNSRIRVMLGYLVGAPHIMAMGDDSVEVGTPGAREQYEKLGHIVKMFNKSCNGFEFCSTKIYEKDGKIIGEPVNWSRTFYRLLHVTSSHQEHLLQFQFEMRHSPHLQPCLNALKRIGWGSSNHVEEAATEEGSEEEKCGKWAPSGESS
jgi:hypothetical protein